MIQNIIIPERIGSYYLFSTHIVGIDIGKTEIHAVMTKANGNKRTIINLFEEKIENDNESTYEERILKSLKILKTKLGNYDLLYVAYPSSSVIFKELTIPFLGMKKVKMVVPFEVESLLPFTLDQAVLDSILTRENKKEKSTDLLVAAVKKESIDQFLSLFNQAGITVNKITIDIFELYALYKSIPDYEKLTDIVSLVNINLSSTIIGITIDNQLKYIRVIHKGLLGVAKKIGLSIEKETNEALIHLLRFGFTQSQSKNYEKASKEALNELLQEIHFTITTYIKKVKDRDHKISYLISGKIADIPDLKEFASQMLDSYVDILEAKKIMHNGKVSSKVSILPNNFLISLATSLSLETTEEFNLNKKQEQIKEDSIINKQLIALSLLTLSILISFSVFSYFRIRNLKLIIFKNEQEAISELKKYFSLKEPRSLQEANKKSENELRRQETTWQQLSIENRYSFLRYLSELSKCINPKEIQLDLTSISIKDNELKIYGSVPGYSQLSKLQNQLKCPVFKTVPKLREYNFKANPIVLTLKESKED